MDLDLVPKMVPFLDSILRGSTLQQTVALQSASPQKPFKRKRHFWNQGGGGRRGCDVTNNWAGLILEIEQGGPKYWRNEARLFPVPGARFVDLANPLLCS